MTLGDTVLRSTWFNQGDVDDLVYAGLNTVRIPVGMLCELFPSSA